MLSGEIQAFKMPLIDIINNLHKNIGQALDYHAIDENSDLVLDHFRKAEIEKIFQFDFSPEALIMNFEKFLPEYKGLDKMINYIQGQKFNSFRDVINITALWRPRCKEIIDRIELYKTAKNKKYTYGFLSSEIEEYLKPNFGLIIYHEDLIKIISTYTGWSFAKCNTLRRLCLFKPKPAEREKETDWIEFTKLAPKKVVDLIDEESQWTFCMPHAISFSQFTKQTAILKSLHKHIYYAEIEKFELKHGFAWDDIGLYNKGVSLHQG